MNQNLKNSAQALLAMQRMSWEQGVAAQAFLSTGGLTSDSLWSGRPCAAPTGRACWGLLIRRWIPLTAGPTDCPLYYAYQYTGDRAYWAALQRLADWLEFSPPGRLRPSVS